MKKGLLFLASMLLVAGTMMAQTIVPTTTEKRNVVIEEFTGHNCGWCPSGHQIANEIAEEYSGHAWPINIHQGGFASGSGYTTTYGDVLATLWNIDGYPCGTVNRSTMQGRGEWAARAASIRNEDSPVNIAAVGNLDIASRTYTLHIEVYYTANAPEATQLLNVAVLQNNVLGHQSNNDGSNAEFIEGDLYRHMHMFRTLLTGQWGNTIPATQGTFIDTTITYVVPEAIEGLAIADPSDLEFIVFVTNPNHKTITTAAKATIITETPVLSRLKIEREDCSLDFQPVVTIFNSSESTFNSFTFDINGTSYTSNTTIPSLGTATINLPVRTINVSGEAVQHCASTVTVSLTGCTRADGQTFDMSGMSRSATYAEFDIYTVESPFEVKIGIDYFGSECSLQFLKQNNCSVQWTADGFTDLTEPALNTIQYISQIPNARYYYYKFANTDPGLYILRMVDGYGDGWSFTNNDVVSGLWLSNANGEIVSFPQGYSNGISFSTYDFYLNITNAGDGSFVGIDDVEGANVAMSVYPNPATEQVTVKAEGMINSYRMVDVAGRQVMAAQGKNASEMVLNVSSLPQGVYFLSITTEKGVATQRVNVVK